MWMVVRGGAPLQGALKHHLDEPVPPVTAKKASGFCLPPLRLVYVNTSEFSFSSVLTLSEEVSYNVLLKYESYLLKASQHDFLV